jgi:voltage-gated potassium channel
VRFVRRAWPDLLIVVLPFLRPLRIVRSARALRLLRLSRLSVVFAAVGQGSKRMLVRHKLHYALLSTVAVGLGAALLVLELERGAGGSINSVGDALWWAAATMTTVGYGDIVPVTSAGRAVGFVLMLSGITMFGVLTANLAAFMVEQDADVDDADEGDSDRLVMVERQLAELTEEIRRLRSAA